MANKSCVESIHWVKMPRVDKGINNIKVFEVGLIVEWLAQYRQMR